MSESLTKEQEQEKFRKSLMSRYISYYTEQGLSIRDQKTSTVVTYNLKTRLPVHVINIVLENYTGEDPVSFVKNYEATKEESELEEFEKEYQNESRTPNYGIGEGTYMMNMRLESEKIGEAFRAYYTAWFGKDKKFEALIEATQDFLFGKDKLGRFPQLINSELSVQKIREYFSLKDIDKIIYFVENSFFTKDNSKTPVSFAEISYYKAMILKKIR